MPRIPQYFFQPEPTQSSNVRADPGMYDGLAQAGRNIGNAISGLGEVAAQEAVRMKQKMKAVDDFTAINNQQIQLEEARNKFHAELNESSDENKWGDELAKRLDAVEKQTMPNDASPETRARLALQAKAFRVQSVGAINLEAKKVKVKKGIQAGEARGEQILNSGQPDAIVRYRQHLDEMASNGLIHKEAVDGLVQAGQQTIEHAQATNEVNEIKNLVPKAAKETATDFAANIMQKDDSGNYIIYPELTQTKRLQLQDAAERVARDAQQKMDVRGNQLVRDFRMGRGNLENVSEEIKNGNIDEDTARVLAPELFAAAAEYDARTEEGRRKIEERKLAETARRDAAAEAVRKNAFAKRGIVSIADVERMDALGRFNDGEASQLKEEIIQQAQFELTAKGGEAQLISDQIDGEWYQRLVGRQPDDSEYQNLAILIGSANLTKQTRLALMDKLFTLKLSDLADSEEEGSPERFSDRKISDPEMAMRSSLIAEYRKIAPFTHESAMAGLFFNQEQQIRDFFDKAPGGKRTQAEIDDFKNKSLMSKVHEISGTANDDFYGVMQ